MVDEIKKYSKIYDVHKYWSRKPWHPISEHIKKYSKKGDLVVDLFFGSGVTTLESVIIDRNFKGFDLNPISIFISENTVEYDVDLEKFRIELGIIEKKIDGLVRELYHVKKACQICGNNMIIQHLNIGPKFVDKETGYLFCGDCGKRKTKNVVAISKKELKRAHKRYKIRKWVPQTVFPEKFLKDRFSYKGVKKVNDMFTNRNLYFLSELHDVIRNSDLEYENLFLLGFSNTLIHASKLKAENVRPLSVNSFWIPDDYFEENPWERFLERINLIIKAKETLIDRIDGGKIGKFELYNRSSLNTGLSDESVDYILTDPPYGDGIQYSELSYIWNAWMNENYTIEEEVIINPKQEKGLTEYLTLMSKSVSEAKRILKNGKYYTLCFHNKEFKIWQGVLELFKNNDFTLEDIEIINTKGSSYNTHWSKFNPKNDVYLTFKRSKFEYTHKQEYSVEGLIKTILKSKKDLDTSEIYDLLVVKLVHEIYFNEYEIDLSKLTIKKVRSIAETINGN